VHVDVGRQPPGNLLVDNIANIATFQSAYERRKIARPLNRANSFAAQYLAIRKSLDPHCLVSWPMHQLLPAWQQHELLVKILHQERYLQHNSSELGYGDTNAWLHD
jgi:hypothetical protein